MFNAKVLGVSTSAVQGRAARSTVRQIASQRVGSNRQACGFKPCGAGRDVGRVMYADNGVGTAKKEFTSVGDVMTKGSIFTVQPETSVLEALKLLVEERVTGLPVVDDESKVVGVVSDFDLLALDLVEMDQGMFPPLGQSWQAFNEVKRLIEKVEGKTVGDVMTQNPVVVRPETSVDAAAKLLLESKIRRLPVVDKEGLLVGLVTRRDIVVAALGARTAKDASTSVV